MKVGIITFHASHNYGSMLQAYALQQTVMKLGHECEIINFRTERQKRFYRPFYFVKGWRPKVKALVFPKLAFNDWRKYRLFERFLKEKLILSEKEYHTSEELANAGLDYDAYISGSDQIWNTHCFDFDWAYYLNFVRKGKKIAYAASMGPIPDLQVLEVNDSEIVNNVTDYDAISVRENNTNKRLKKAGINDIGCVNLDPTLLIDRIGWEKIILEEPLIKGNYIYLYTPWFSEHFEKVYEKAASLAEKRNMKVVVSKSEGYKKWKNNNFFEFYTAVGPLEFLNLIKNAKIIIAESFHAVVFSLIFNKPFIILNGNADSRISNLIALLDLKKSSISENGSLIFDSIETSDFGTTLIPNIKESIDFLKKAID